MIFRIVIIGDILFFYNYLLLHSIISNIINLNIFRFRQAYMDTLDWQELANSRKEVRDRHKYPCGNLIAEYKDNIIILEGDLSLMNIWFQNPE